MALVSTILHSYPHTWDWGIWVIIEQLISKYVLAPLKNRSFSPRLNGLHDSYLLLNHYGGAQYEWNWRAMLDIPSATVSSAKTPLVPLEPGVMCH